MKEGKYIGLSVYPFGADGLELRERSGIIL